MKKHRSTKMLLLALLVALASCTATPPSLNVKVNKTTGSFTVTVGSPESPSIILTSSTIGYMSNGLWYTNDESFKPSGGRIWPTPTPIPTTLLWKGGPSAISFETSIVDLESSGIIEFIQKFSNGVANVSVGERKKGDVDDIASSFPSFEVGGSTGGDEGDESGLNFLTWSGVFCKPKIGKFSSGGSCAYRGGHGGGPVVLYARDLTSVVVAPSSNDLLTAVMTRDSPTVGPSKWVSGIGGAVRFLPKGYEHKTTLAVGSTVREAAYGWGDYVLSSIGRSRIPVSSNQPILGNLGYWTDNGAYYYYHTELPYLYEGTILNVWKYDVEEESGLKLPVKSAQWDSWWYYKGEDHGVRLWEPRFDVFPRGMEYVDKKIGVPVALHNRWFSEKNDYMKMGYPFYVAKDCSLPKTKALFTYIMAKAKSWGMSMYEQDWLDHTWDNMPVIAEDPTVGSAWLKNMASAAKDLNLTIQYCMPYPTQMMQTLHVDQVVTNARASDDYQPGNSQWKVGFTSLMYYGMLGIVPFKDNFWTTDKEQSDCKYRDRGGCVEPNPVLQGIVAALSLGPVGFSDKIKFTDPVLVMETCRADGVLLKPDLPAVPLDAAFLPPYWDEGAAPEVWETKNCLMSSVSCWHYVLGADLSVPFELKVDMIDLVSAKFVAVKHALGATSVTLLPFDSSHSLVLGGHQTKRDSLAPSHVPYDLYQIAPLSSGCKYSFVKELGKIVSASQTRVSGLTCDPTQLSMTISGKSGESVGLVFVENAEPLTPILGKCAIGSSGRSRVVVRDGVASC